MVVCDHSYSIYIKKSDYYHIAVATIFLQPLVGLLFVTLIKLDFT